MVVVVGVILILIIIIIIITESITELVLSCCAVHNPQIVTSSVIPGD